MKQNLSTTLQVSISALAIVAAVGGGIVLASAVLPMSAAQADTHSDDGHSGGSGGGGHSGGSGGGHDGADHDDGGDDHGSGGQGGRRAGKGGSDHGGDHEDSDHAGGKKGGAQGQQGGARAAGAGVPRGQGGAGGGRPVWAQEGIPSVELGRLNVVRSPDHVLTRAEAEALATLLGNPSIVALYNQSLPTIINTLETKWDDTTIIDSPLQNLALFEATLRNSPALANVGVTNDRDTLMAAFLGVASDKAMPITTDTVIAVTTMMGVSVSPAEAAAIAADAEAVRQAVAAGHG